MKSTSARHLEASAKAEPLSPLCSSDDLWTLDSLEFREDILTSIPLSLIQQDRSFPPHQNIFLHDNSVLSILQHSPASPAFFPTPEDSSSCSDYGQQQQQQHLVPGGWETELVKSELDQLSSPPLSPDGGAQKPSRSRAQMASLLLRELDQPKEEPNSDWIEEKNIELPIFEEFKPASVLPLHDTQTLLTEFENVFSGYKQYSQFPTHLTPPQSPPLPQAPVYQPAWTQQAQPQFATNTCVDFSSSFLQVEPVQNIQQDFNWQNAESQFVPSPVSTDSSENPDYNAYFPQDFQYPESESPKAGFTSGNNSFVAPVPEHAYAKSHEDFLHAAPCSPNSSSSSSVYGSSENDDDWAPSSSPDGRVRVRSKPYSRNPDDKRSRKKEQNKKAATRYRQKKKEEVEVLAGEEKELQRVRDELDKKCVELRREVKLLKGLMRDICRAKGLIK